MNTPKPLIIELNKLLESGITLVIESIEKSESLSGYDFPVYDAGQGYFTVELKDQEHKEKYKNELEKVHQRTSSTYKAEEGKTTEELQIPEIVAIFQYGGKRYITISAKKDPQGESNGFKYKGLLIDPLKYSLDIQGNLFESLNNSEQK